MDARPVFVVVTAKHCPYCDSFKNNWPDIRAAVEGLNLVRIEHIEVKSLEDKPDPKDYPADLARWIGWVPTFFLFRAGSWDAAQPRNGPASARVKLEGSVFNGFFSKSGELQLIKGKPHTRDNLVDWIKSELNSGRFAGATHDVRSSEAPNILSLLSAANGQRTTPVSNLEPRVAPTVRAQSPQEIVPNNVCRLKLIPHNRYSK